MMTRTLPLAAAALMGVVALGDIATSTSMANAQQRSDAEIEAIVRNYLLEHPEVIFEAAERYQDKQRELARAAAEETARTALPGLRENPAGHVLAATGDDTNVVVVEFFDYNCGFCRRATDFVFDLKAKDDDLELVFQELPVTNQASRGPALAALAIAGTEHYAPFHREIMQAAGLVDADRALVIAEELGVPVGPIEAALAEGAAQEALHARLDESIDLADALGIDGTPAFLIASPDASFVRIIPGYNEAAIREAVADARAATKG